MTTVRWRQWVTTWRHVSAGAFGHYEDKSRDFKSVDEARAFAEGLSTNPDAREVTVVPTTGVRR